MPLVFRGRGGSLGRGGGGGASPSFDTYPLTPGDFVATATGTPPTLGNNNNVQNWAFNDAATGEMVTAFYLPPTWRQVSVGFFWINPNAGAGNVRWRVAMKKLDTGDLSSEAFAADTSATVAAGAQNAINLRANHLTAFDVTPGLFGSMYALLISRIGADAADTLAGNAEVSAVALAKTA